MTYAAPYTDDAENLQDDDLKLLSRRRSLEDGTGLQSPLETYLREINETKLLSAAEEQDLARRIASGDPLARDHMVRANLRLVVNIARGYVSKGLGLQDLIEEGNLGLLRAVEDLIPTWGLGSALTRVIGSSNRSNVRSSIPRRRFAFRLIWSSCSASGDVPQPA